MASIEYRVICIILPRSRRVQTSLSDAPLPYLHVRQELIVFTVFDISSYQRRLCSTEIFLPLTSSTEASILLIFLIFCSPATEKVSCLYTGIEIRRLSPKRRRSVMWICSFPSKRAMHRDARKTANPHDGASSFGRKPSYLNTRVQTAYLLSSGGTDDKKDQ